MALTTNGNRVKQYDYDPECTRTTHRLQSARRVLATLHCTPTKQHDDAAHAQWGGCDYRCTETWPEWASDDLFNFAWQVANEAITRCGQFNQRAASRLHDEACRQRAATR